MFHYFLSKVIRFGYVILLHYLSSNYAVTHVCDWLYLSYLVDFRFYRGSYLRFHSLIIIFLSFIQAVAFYITSYIWFPFSYLSNFERILSIISILQTLLSILMIQSNICLFKDFIQLAFNLIYLILILTILLAFNWTNPSFLIILACFILAYSTLISDPSVSLKLIVILLIMN